MILYIILHVSFGISRGQAPLSKASYRKITSKGPPRSPSLHAESEQQVCPVQSKAKSLMFQGITKSHGISAGLFLPVVCIGVEAINRRPKPTQSKDDLHRCCQQRE